MERWVGKVALVTGASAGCGAKIAETLVRYGMSVIGCARNTSTIEELSESLRESKGKLHALKCDVSCDSDVKALFTDIRRDFGRLDVCVNNAGFSFDAPLLTGTTEEWRKMLEVNALAVSVFTRETVEIFKECGIDDGHIININSLHSRKMGPAPDIYMYFASKCAATAITEGTRAELRENKSHNRITQISPGGIVTEFCQRMYGMTPEQGQEFYSRGPRLKTEDISDAVIYALSAPPHVQVHDIVLGHVEM